MKYKGNCRSFYDTVVSRSLSGLSFRRRWKSGRLAFAGIEGSSGRLSMPWSIWARVVRAVTAEFEGDSPRITLAAAHAAACRYRPPARRFAPPVCRRQLQPDRGTRHLLAALEEFNHLGVRFVSVQDQIDVRVLQFIAKKPCLGSLKRSP